MDYLSEIQTLLGSVPAAPEYIQPPGVSTDVIDAFTKRTNIAVPEDLQVWLRHANGLSIGPGGLYGIQTARKGLDIEYHYRIFPQWKVKCWIPIAGDGNGNYYILDSHTGGNPILFVDVHEDPDLPTFIVASNIWHFLAFLLKRELNEPGWPFRREYVILHDPSIIQYLNVRMPWETNKGSPMILNDIIEEIKTTTGISDVHIVDSKKTVLGVGNLYGGLNAEIALTPGAILQIGDLFLVEDIDEKGSWHLGARDRQSGAIRCWGHYETLGEALESL